PAPPSPCTLSLPDALPIYVLVTGGPRLDAEYFVVEQVGLLGEVGQRTYAVLSDHVVRYDRGVLRTGHHGAGDLDPPLAQILLVDGSLTRPPVAEIGVGLTVREGLRAQWYGQFVDACAVAEPAQHL